MEYNVKLTAGLPKGPANGWADQLLAAELYRTRAQRREEQPRVAVIVYGIKKTEALDDDLNQTSVKILRVQPVASVEGRRIAENLLADEYAVQHLGSMLPHDLVALSKSAFADLPKTAAEIDQEESAEQDLMSPTDELRRHLERVHGRDDAAGMTALEAAQRHVADHDDGELPEELAHDREWMGWTRADIEASADMAEGGGLDFTTPGDDAIHAGIPIEGDPDDDDAVAAEIDAAEARLEAEDDGTPTLDELEGPDPDYGKDLDDEDRDDSPGHGWEGRS